MTNIKKERIGLLYLSLHNHLKKKFGYKPISKRDFFALLGRHFLIPKPLRIVILKEMEQEELIEMCPNEQGREEHLVVTNTRINIEEEASKFYRRMKFY